MNTLIICLFIAIMLPYLVRLIVARFMAREGYNNHYPRLQQAHLEGLGARALGAHQNGFESLLVFATAALTAMVTHHVGAFVQVLAVIYISSRVIYNLLYLKDMASARSAVWTIGFLC